MDNKIDPGALARSPLAFGAHFLPHYFTSKSPPFHNALCKLWRQSVMKNKNPLIEVDREVMLSAKGNKIAVAAPRGHAKSTIMSLQNVLHAALYGYKKYIIIISDTESQASSFLDCIKSELEYNDLLIEQFGEQKGKVWKSTVILLQNGCRIDAVGSGQKLRGRRHGPRRPDLILLDDIENDEEVRTKEGRERLAVWYFGAVSKAGDRFTDMVLIGTALHYDSLLMKLMVNPAYRCLRFKAIEQFSESPLWDKWREIYTDLNNENRQKQADRFFSKHRTLMLKGTKVLWPSKMPYYDLICMMISDGEASFLREMQNMPVDPDTCLFPKRWTRYYGRDIDFSQAHYSFFGYCDPSLGKNAGGDYSAIVTVALDGQSGKIFVESADICRRHPDQIISDVLAKAAELRSRFGKGYTLFGAESNQFQWFLKEQLAKESARLGIWLPISEVYSSGDKVMRIQSLQPDIKNGYLLFGEGQDQLLRQLWEFPVGRYDDGPDALEGAVALCKRGGRLSTIDGLKV